MLDRDVQAAADRGDLVEAIKLLREKTGMGLKESKDAVEAYLHGDVEVSAKQPEGIPVAAISALHEGRMIEAIRLTREANGRGLKESKAAVDHYLAANPMVRERFQVAARRERNPLRTLFILAVVVAAIVAAALALMK